MMQEFGFLLKSYEADYEYAQRCLRSYAEMNVEGLDLYLVVPPADVERFSSLAVDHVHVLSETLLSAYLTDAPLGGLRAGYVNQEVVKLAFWELGLLRNYLCVDSDAVFIRPILRSDYMATETVPFTVLVEDKDLEIQPRYYSDHWKDRESQLRKIQAEVGLEDPIIRTCHGHQVMSARVLQDFKLNFLEPRGWEYLDALAIAPYEFTWYNMWAQKSGVIPLVMREPFAKVFHNEDQHLDAILRGVRITDIARAYSLLVINSNYSRDLGVMDAASSKPELLSRYLSYGELTGILREKLRDTWRRRASGSRSR